MSIAIPIPNAKASQKPRNMNKGSIPLGGVSVGGKIVRSMRRINTVSTAATATSTIFDRFKDLQTRQSSILNV